MTVDCEWISVLLSPVLRISNTFLYIFFSIGTLLGHSMTFLPLEFIENIYDA